MSDTPSTWRLRAICSSCQQPFALTATVVLLRQTLFGPRGVLLDVLGERWPEAGRLFHPVCFARRFGRRPLWVSFVRGRFDKGVAQTASSAAKPGDNLTVPGSSEWSLQVTCCECASQVEVSGCAVVRDERTRQRWLWVPELQQRRPGQRQVSHLRCFVNAYGRPAAYAALGRETWERLGPVIRKVGGAVNPGPF